MCDFPEFIITINLLIRISQRIIIFKVLQLNQDALIRYIISMQILFENPILFLAFSMQIDHDSAPGPADQETAVNEGRVYYYPVFVALELGHRVPQNLHD
jgi:hypothetical protein